MVHKHTPGTRPHDLNVLNITQVETFVKTAPHAWITLIKKAIRHESVQHFVIKVAPLLVQRLAFELFDQSTPLRSPIDFDTYAVTCADCGKLVDSQRDLTSHQVDQHYRRVEARKYAFGAD